MNRWNAHINSHFAGCKLLAEGFDLCRGRQAKAYVIPGDAENFGITDGTDAWVIPVRAGAGGNIFKGADLHDMVRRHFAGEQVDAFRSPPPGARRRVSLDDSVEFVPVAASPIPPRRRVALDDSPATAETTTRLRRHHVSI